MCEKVLLELVCHFPWPPSATASRARSRSLWQMDPECSLGAHHQRQALWAGDPLKVHKLYLYTEDQKVGGGTSTAL